MKRNEFDGEAWRIICEHLYFHDTEDMPKLYDKLWGVLKDYDRN